MKNRSFKSNEKREGKKTFYLENTSPTTIDYTKTRITRKTLKRNKENMKNHVIDILLRVSTTFHICFFSME